MQSRYYGVIVEHKFLCCQEGNVAEERLTAEVAENAEKWVS